MHLLGIVLSSVTVDMLMVKLILNLRVLSLPYLIECRKYLRQNIHVELPRLVGLADEMWRVMKPEDKKVYQDQAKRLGEGHMKKRALYEGILVEYKRLLESVGSPGKRSSLHTYLYFLDEPVAFCAWFTSFVVHPTIS